MSVLPLEFAHPEPPSSGRWLSSIGHVLATIERCPEMDRAVRAAAKRVACRDSIRGESSRIEAALYRELDQSEAERWVLGAITDPLPGLGTLTGLRWEEHPGEHALCDQTLVLTTSDAGAVRVPLNVKHLRTSNRARWNDGGSIRTLMAVALGLPVTRPVTNSLDTDLLLLRWQAGLEKIQRGDYAWLVVRGDKRSGSVASWSLFGSFSSVARDGLTVRVFPARPKSSSVCEPSGRLPDLQDINAALTGALSPPVSPTLLRRVAARWLADTVGAEGEQRRRIAERLLAISDDELAAALLTTLGIEGEDGAAGDEAAA